MMKVDINAEELYPVYYISDRGHPNSQEVPDVVVQEWDRIAGEWQQMQEQMWTYYTKVNP